MTATGFESAFHKVQQLVANFQASTGYFLSATYQEAEVRKDFIDKFFIALGWDVNHERQPNPYEQEVKVERGVAAGAAKRRADYAFFIAPNFRDPRFMVEAKKPAHELAYADTYFQTIRYGWNKGNPLAVVTHFQELHVLDCRDKPDIETAVNRRVNRFHYTEYTDRDKFAEIYWLISREAVASGSLEKFAAGLPKPKRAARQRRLFGRCLTIDESFLEDLDGYRLSLARAFKKQNPELDSETLTEITQRTLDRLVFIRFFEDKLIEAEHVVARFAESEAPWPKFVAASQRLDGAYNGLIFKRHPLIDRPDFTLDEAAFADICRQLSHEYSPYDFNSIPIHILGSIYERFLGNVIVATDKRARVEPKPKVRKAGGVYYTPDYIVQYIVDNTVGKLIEGKTPAQIAQMTFADIACGSGSFLLGVYDSLLRYHAKWYNDNPSKGKKGDCVERDGVLVPSLHKKRDILINNIYGVDIDPQAVEVTQLSLYLKLLEDETIGSIHQCQKGQRELYATVLPSLDRNILCGNSLLGRDIGAGRLFAIDEEKKLNPMNFENVFPEVMRRGGFDAVVGNPPYGMVTDDLQKHYFKNSFKTTEGRFDTFELFIERALGLCLKGGLVGYIVPSPVLSNLYARRLRRHLLDNCSIQEISNFAMDVFSDPTIHTCVVVISPDRAKPNHGVRIRKQVMSADALSGDHDFEIEQSKLGTGPTSTIDVFVDADVTGLLERIQGRSQPLGDLCFIRQCIKTGDDHKYVKRSDSPLSRPWKPTLRGKSIGRYATQEKILYLKYGSWLARNWKNKSFYETPKIAIRETGNRIIATLDLDNRYFLSSLYAIYPKGVDESRHLNFFLAILNSSLATYFVKKVAFDLTKGAFTKIRTNQLARLPIPRIDFANPADKARHDKIVSLVDQMLEVKNHLSAVRTERDRNFYERKCAHLDREIDQIVFELYGLTEEEIGLVEGKQA